VTGESATVAKWRCVLAFSARGGACVRMGA
jgi:hypothetical protein